MDRTILGRVATALCALGAMLGAAWAQTITDGSDRVVGGQSAAEAVALIGRGLKDRESARVTGLRPGRAGAVCGQLDRRNRMGDYTGPRGFVADPAAGFAGLSPESPELRAPASAADYQAAQRARTLYRANCMLD